MTLASNVTNYLTAARDLAASEPLLRARVDHEIVTPAPLADVVSTPKRVARPGRGANR